MKKTPKILHSLKELDVLRESMAAVGKPSGADKSAVGDPTNTASTKEK
jgi:hypothetical protein